MDIKKKLQEQFIEIKDAFFEKEMGMKFLRVETTLRDLEEVTKLSRKISDYLDEIDKSDAEYYLDVYSAGTDSSLDKNDLQENLNKNVLVTLNKRIKDFDGFEGQLLSADDKIVIIRWNAMGQFRKQEIELDNIKEIKLSAKLNK